MADIRTNIFGIGEVYELQKEGQWVERNRESYREFGYVFNINATTDRIDYSNDSNITIPRGTCFGTSSGAATGNSNFGYTGGRYFSGDSTRVDRLDYSNDSSNTITRGGLSLARGRLSAAGNQNFGYFVCGISFTPGNSGTRVDRIDYSNDLNAASVRGNGLILRLNSSSTANSNFLYTSQGPTGSTERITFSNDLVLMTARGATYNTANTGGAATGNQNFGYFGGGQPGGLLSRIDRINYANDTANSVTRSNLSSPRARLTATGSSNFGYFISGILASTVAQTTVDRLDYSNDTAVVSVRGPLRVANEWYGSGSTSSASFGGAPVSYLGAPWTSTAPFGYFGGGTAPARVSTVDRVDYTNDTNTAVVRGPLTDSRSGLAATGNSNFGYFGGGSPTLPTFTSIIDRIQYSNDTGSASLRGVLTIARRHIFATGNSNFGYFGGGYAGPGNATISRVDRLDYNNDTANTTARGSLSLSKYDAAATGNSNFGYFGGGGIVPAVLSTVDRIDYSNDTNTAAVRSSLSLARRLLSATGNNNFGYFGGGYGSPGLFYSRMDRIDFSNDTTIALVRGSLSLSRYGPAATGNSNFGYFGGGYTNPGTVFYSIVDRLDYSNDTQNASTRGPLSSVRVSPTASSSQAYGGAPNTTVDPLPSYIRAATKWIDSNTLDLPFKRVLGSYGYFGGGRSAISTVDRINYSNDTASASVRGPLAATSYDMVAAGNNNFGYYTGRLSTFNKIDYSNDSTQALVRGSIPFQETNIRTAVGNSNFGYFRQTHGTFQLNRLDYSNDSVATSSRFIVSRSSQDAATGNFNFGYFGGGAFITNVDRMSYANDTANILRRGDLTIARNTLAATGNSNFGYFGGGQIVPNIIYSRVDRIDYSNDTATASVRGPLSVARRNLAATGNSNFGYFGGGNFPASYSLVNRIDYSNDTQTASTRGLLSSVRDTLAASTNARSS
jgi:hypothetical protein